MGRVGVAITKYTTWRGQNEEFSNVYHFDVDATVDANLAGQLVTAVKTLELPVFANLVTFKSARVWSAGGTAAQNDTILLQDMTGTGSGTASQSINRELTVVVNLGTGRKTSTGRKIYLRKYIHCAALPSIVSGVPEGTNPLSSAQKAPFISYGQGIRQFAINANASATLEGPQGQNIDNTAPVTVLDYLHTRQFRWTGKRH